MGSILSDDKKEPYMTTLAGLKASASSLETENKDILSANTFYADVQEHYTEVSDYHDRLSGYEQRIEEATTCAELLAVIKEIEEDAGKIMESCLTPVISDYSDLEEIEERVTAISSELEACRSQFETLFYAEQTIELPDGYIFSTFSANVALDFTDNEDAKVYTAKVEGETVVLTQIDIVPANTGVIIERISESTYTIVSVADDVDELGDEDNALVAVQKEMSAQELVADNAYILFDDYQFKKVTPNATGTLAIGKAYLRVPTTTNAASLAIGFGGDDGATGLTEKTAHYKDEHAAIYNLNGQRVTQPTKGLYIVNGKKVIIK